MLTKADIKRMRSLGDKAGRTALGLFVAEGEKLAGELLASDFRVREVYRVGENVSASEMARISFLRTPTPVLAAYLADECTGRPGASMGEYWLQTRGEIG